MEDDIIGDIEDVADFQSKVSSHQAQGTHQHKQSTKKKLEQKTQNQKKNQKSQIKQGNLSEQQEVQASNESKPSKVFFYTYGCSHNQSDSEFMQGVLQDEGYEITQNYEESNIVVVVSCTVKGPSQQSCVNDVLRAQQHKKYVVVAGCVPQADRSIEQLKNVSTIGIMQIDKIALVVKETLKGNIIKYQELDKLPPLNFHKVRKNKLIEILAISGGCLGACTFCKTKHSRGKLISYRPQVLVDRVKQACAEGVKEIWITSEDTGAYGRDIGTNISHLLYRMVEVLPDNVMIRLGMTNPPYMWQHIENMVAILNHPQVYKFVHICVQSGNNEVLQNMNRQYQIEEFTKIIDYLKQRVPNITVATDVICGFPGETDAQFEDTMNLVKKYKFPILNISQFYSRPGTAAAKMKKCNTKDIKARSTKITALFDSYDKTSHILNTVQRVLISDMQEKNGEKQLIGHTQQYVKVILPYDEKLLGKTVLLKVKESKTWHVEGEIVDYNPKPEKISGGYFKSYQTIQNIVSEEEKQEYNLGMLITKNKKAIVEPTVKQNTQKFMTVLTQIGTLFSSILTQNGILCISFLLIIIGWFLSGKQK